MEAPRLTQTTITILPNEEWLTTEQVMHALGKSQRTVQKLAQAGLLKWKLVTRVGTSPGRVYDAKDVRALVPVVPKPTPQTTHHTHKTPQKKAPHHTIDRQTRTIEARLEKAVGNIEMVGQFLAFMKAGQEAEHERRKAYYEDRRERWEVEQKQAAAERAEQKERAKPWLTLDEAVAQYGLPAAAIRAAVKAI